MTQYRLKIGSQLGDFADLEALATALKDWTGHPVLVIESYEILTGSEQIAKALEVLTGVKAEVSQTRMPDGLETTDTSKANLGEHGAAWQAADDRFPELPEERQRGRGPDMTVKRNRGAAKWGEIKAWQVLPPNHQTPICRITKSDKESRLNKGTFVEGTILYHPQGGRWKVVGPHGEPQALERTQ